MKKKKKEPNKVDESQDLTESDQAATDPATAGDESTDTPPDELTQLRAERDQFEDKLKRSMADLANFRRRQVRDLDDARRRTIEALTVELLPVLDNFHLALGAAEQPHAGETTAPVQADPIQIVEGLRMVRAMLQGTLERHGLAEVAAQDASFDPNQHEAVGIDAEAEAEAGTITKVLQAGYKIGDKVLRAARVVVAGEPDSSESAEG